MNDPIELMTADIVEEKTGTQDEVVSLLKSIGEGVAAVLAAITNTNTETKSGTETETETETE